MNSTDIRLSDVPLSTCCVVKNILGDVVNKRRLFDLGFFEGSKIAPLYESAGGGTMAYSVKGTIIALRKEEASQIIIQQISKQGMQPAMGEVINNE